jgi:hypothetical protein
VEGVLADILDKQVQIKKIGFDIMGPDNKIKTFDSIIKGIITATKGNESILGSIFGRESIRSISMLAKAYRDTGGFKLFDELSNADAGNANEILKDFAQYSKSARFQLMQLSNIAWDFADSALSPVIEDLNKYLSELTNNPEKLAKFREEIGQIGKNIGTTAASVADLVAALSKFIPLLKIMGVAVDYTTGPFQLGHYLANDYSNDKNSADAAIAKYNAPIIKQRVASILEWEKKSGVRFRNDNIIRNVINAEINISDSGRVAVRTNDSNATIKANVNRGSFPGVRK